MNNGKKNVLIVAYNDLNNSGVPNVIYQIVSAAHNKYNFDIIVFGDNDYYYQKMINDGIDNIKIIKFEDHKPNSRFGKMWFYLHSNPKDRYKKTLELLKKRQYVAIHSFKEYDSWPFLKAAKEAGLEKRIIHTTVIHSKKGDYLLAKGKRLSLKYATEFIGVTEISCESAFPKKNHDVIHFSYNDKEYNEENGKGELGNDELVLTQVATYSSNKNQLFSLEVIDELRKMHQNVKLKLIGGETEPGYLNQMQSFIKDKNLQNYVELIDGSNGAASHMKHTSFCLLTSFHEGASLVVVESQACGIKVFASSCVSKEMNAGGITYLDLNDGPKKWAKDMHRHYSK